MATYLVTGGAGFIGSGIVEELVRRGEAVRVLDNFSTGRRENIAPFLKDIELIGGDLRHLDTVRQAVDGVDYILHQGPFPPSRNPLMTRWTRMNPTCGVP